MEIARATRDSWPVSVLRQRRVRRLPSACKSRRRVQQLRKKTEAILVFIIMAQAMYQKP